MTVNPNSETASAAATAQPRKTTRWVIIAVVAVLVAAAVWLALLATHVIGNTPATSEAEPGQARDYGANAGRAWAGYKHDTQWHRASVSGHGQASSECMAPGQWARVSVDQSWIGRNSFSFEQCDAPAHSS